ncbi:MAG: AMP-binding protein [Gammaproteobacteria bacterium]|nr:MAG: AMP-binding protein [Gammaproteobacteria bacterium]
MAPEGRFSWSEFADRVRRCATLLVEFGLEPGERFAIIGHNSFRQAELIRAGYWAGLVPVPINYRLAPPEIAYILDNAECRLVAIEAPFATIMASEDLAPWAQRTLSIEPMQYEQRLDSAKIAPMHEPAETDDALLVYTGGTTGRAKGVRLSHTNILLNALQIAFVARPRVDDIFLHAAPMFHSADLLATPWMMAGAAHIYLPEFSGDKALEAIQEHRVTCCVLTPTMIIMMLQQPDFERYDLGSLRQVIYGSSPMAVEWILHAMQGFPGVEFIQAYGLTETAPLLTMLEMADHRHALDSGDHRLLQSVGRPLPVVDMKIVDGNDRELPPTEPGEIVVRAPNVAKGYLKRPQATAEAFRDGWFYTGDIGRMDEHGYLYLLDRKKDLIITGGELVYSLEVESALYRNPKVRECAVVGIPDEAFGEALLAAIVPAAGESPTAEELIEHCRAHIGGYKIPRRYVFLDELPKSAVNKVLKHELRRIYSTSSSAGETT